MQVVDRDDLWRSIAHLGYHQHGGSGYGYGLGDVLELEYDRMVFLVDLLEETRSAEAAAIRRAHAGGT